jgi:hypothetical protein
VSYSVMWCPPNAPPASQACAAAVPSTCICLSQGLARLREGLRERMLASRLCDGPGFVAGLEETYRQLWHRWLTATDASQRVG